MFILTYAFNYTSVDFAFPIVFWVTSETRKFDLKSSSKINFLVLSTSQKLNIEFKNFTN